MTNSYIRYFEQILNGHSVHQAPPILRKVQTEKFLLWED